MSERRLPWKIKWLAVICALLLFAASALAEGASVPEGDAAAATGDTPAATTGDATANTGDAAPVEATPQVTEAGPTPMTLPTMMITDIKTVPDFNRPVSLTLTFLYSSTKEPVTEGTVTIRRIGDLDGNYIERFGEVYDATFWMSEEDQMQAVINYAKRTATTGNTKTESFDENGVVSFTNLENGWYLVTNEITDELHTGFLPFVVGLPTLDEDQNWIYDVNAYPKPGDTSRTPEPTITPTPEPDILVTPTPTPTPPPGVTSPPSDPGRPSNPSLPQTGQLWWPVPVLGVIGILFMIIGWMRQRSKTSNEQK